MSKQRDLLGPDQPSFQCVEPGCAVVWHSLNSLPSFWLAGSHARLALRGRFPHAGLPQKNRHERRCELSHCEKSFVRQNVLSTPADWKLGLNTTWCKSRFGFQSCDPALIPPSLKTRKGNRNGQSMTRSGRPTITNNAPTAIRPARPMPR